MGLDLLGELALQVTFDVIGVPATVTLPDFTEIETSAIWLSPIMFDEPSGADLQRHEPRRVLALTRTAVASVPRGTLIAAAERDGGEVKTWRVEGTDLSDPDHVRVIVVQDS